MNSKPRVLVLARHGDGFTGPSTYRDNLVRHLGGFVELMDQGDPHFDPRNVQVAHLLDVAWASRELLSGLRCPLVTEVHDYYWTRPYTYSAPDLPLRWLNGLRLRARYIPTIARSAAIVTHCEYVRTRVRHPETHNIGISIDASALIPGPPLGSREAIILFAGSNYFRKGLALLARSLPLILKRVPTARLIVAGFERPHTLLAARRMLSGLPVDFVGPQPRAEMQRLYARARVHVLPSAIESSPVTPLEAAACGTPSVAARVGGIPELLDDGRSALLHDVGDHKGLADRVVNLLSNPELGASLAATLNGDLQHRFAPATMVSRLISVYQRVASA